MTRKTGCPVNQLVGHRVEYRTRLSSTTSWALLKEIAPVLLNIDKPHRTSTLHNDDCRTLPSPIGTEFKLVDQLGRDGGWFTVESERTARILAEKEFPRGEFIRCQRC